MDGEGRGRRGSAHHYANQLLSAMRLQFGGHQELPAGDVLEAGGRKADSQG